MKYGAVILAVSISLLVWASKLSGLFESADGWLYDHLVALKPGDDVPEPRVLLVDTGPAPEMIQPAQWQAFIGALNKHVPGLVAFTFIPSYDLTQASPGLRYVVGVSPQSQHPDYRPPAHKPLVSAGSYKHLALLPQARAQGGIHRYAQLSVNNETAFNLRIAQMLDGGISGEAPTRIRVNFNHGVEWLPVVSFERVIKGGLIQELVQGRVVLVGPVSLLNSPGLQTPVSKEGMPMSVTEYEGYTIETLLRGDDIRELPVTIVLFLLLLLSALSLLIYQKMNMAAAGRVTVVLLAVYAVMTWGLLHWLMVWWPLLPLALTQVLLFVLAIRYRQMAGEEALHQVLSNTGRWVRGHIMPEGFVESRQHWAQIMNLVDQSLDLHRLIFLERIAGDHRVREVSSLRCNIDDIDERRRDYERTPYSTAIELGGPLRLQKQYLEPWPEPEQQYLVPLIYADDIVGFWAFSVAPEKLEQLDKFENMVRSFAVQIAEIIYHRSVWQADQVAASKPLARYMMFRAGDDLNQRVIHTLNSLERRWAMVEHMMGGLEACAVLYDPFGRVMNANNAMEKLTSDHSISMYDMSALDLLVRLTRLPIDMAREALSNVLYQKKEVRLPISLSDKDESDYLLSVRAISRQTKNNTASDEVTPFDVRGVLFEIADITRFSAESDVKQLFTERMILQLRNDMEAIITAAQLLGRDTVSDSHRQRVLDIMMGKAQSTNSMLVDAETVLNADYNEVLSKSYPVDLLAIAGAILPDRQVELEKRKISLVVEMPDLLHLARAHANSLSDLLNCMFDVQLNDVNPGSNIYFHLRSMQDFQRILVKGDGIGMPNEELQRFLHGEIDMASDEFKRLREGVKLVSSWGGQFIANSELGKGISFELKLRTVI